MKPNVPLRSTLRQPLRTLALMTFVCLIAFLFTSRAAEYLIVNGETERLGGYYRAIGELEQLSTESSDRAYAKAIEHIRESEYFSYDDQQRAAPAILHGIYNTDLLTFQSPEESGYHKNEVVVCAQLTRTPLHSSEIKNYGIKTTAFSDSDEYYRLQFEAETILAGYPDYLSEGQTMTVFHLVTGDEERDVISQMEKGQRYLIRAYCDMGLTSAPVHWESARNELMLMPLVEGGPWYMPLQEGEQADLDDPRLAGLKNELEIIDQNQHTLEVIGTADLSAAPRTQQSSRLNYLTEGRWLTREDHLGQRKVCVLHQEFADIRGLAVGDMVTLTIPLRHMSADWYHYYIPFEFQETWRDFDSYTDTFEIVGFYNSTLNTSLAAGRGNRMYIPASCMPEAYGDRAWYSFVLSSTRDTDAFLAENQEALAALGYRARFVANNADKFWEAVTPIQESTLLSACISAGVLLTGLALAAFIHIRQRRREFAISRALGIPGGEAGRGMLQAGMLPGLLGIAIGSALSWDYALGKAAETLRAIEVPEGAEVSAALSPAWLAGMIGAAAAVYFLFLLAGTRAVKRRSVLELLQGSAAKQNARRGQMAATGRAVAPHPPEARPAAKTGRATAALGAAAPKGTGRGIAGPARYVLLHVLRSWGKSLLSAALVLALMLALGYMQLAMEQSNEQIDALYETTVVDLEIIQSNVGVAYTSSEETGGNIAEATIDKILGTGIMQSHYLEREMKFNGVYNPTSEDSPVINDVTLHAFSSLEGFEERHGEIEIKYGALFKEDIFTEEYIDALDKNEPIPAVLPSSMLERLGMHLGQYAVLQFQSSASSYRSWTFMVAGRYPDEYMLGMTTAEAPILLSLAALSRFTQEVSMDVNYSLAQFTVAPEKNREFLRIKDELSAIVEEPGAGLVNLTLLAWDEDLTDAIAPMEESLRLLQLLYPVALALAALISAGLSVLLLSQQTREAAALRALGCTKGRVRAMFTAQQGLLCILGLIVGFAALMLLRGGIWEAFSPDSLLCAGLYLAGTLLGAIAGSIAVTWKKPMELLQVKE